MSFAVPQNVPRFNPQQRQIENHIWGSSGQVHGRGVGNSVGDRLNGYFSEKELPMYKDKPYNYGITSSHRRGWRRKRVIVGGILFILGALYWLQLLPHRESKILLGTENSSGWNWLKTTKATDWDGRREEVKAAFIKSWDAYDRHAWGYDEFHPLSGTGHQMTPKGMGWIIVDSLDTLILMNLTSQLSHAREWIATSLDYEQNQEVNTFETTIRMLGGFLSAHYLSTTFPNMAPIEDDDRGTKGEDLYIEKATDLAERLLGAYETKSGIPLASVNLQTMKGIPSTADAGASSTAEAASLQLEMKYLAKLTGEKNYWDKAEKVIEAIDANHAEDGLVPIFIYADAGTFRGENIRLGSRGDSYYEYLIKQYLQTNGQEAIYEEMWDQALAGVRKHLLTYSSPSNMLVLGERPNGLDKELSPKMDHLVCFMPGTIALAATGGSTVSEARASGKWGTKQEKDMILARELMKTCWGMYKFTATGLAPEIAHFNMYDPPHMAEDPTYATVTPPAELGDEEDASWRQDYIIKPADKHNLQRPETVESLFYMYRITGDEMYREWGWEMFQSFMKYSAVENDGGFTSLADVTRIPPPTRDNMESFWLAETLKYFYLLFSPTDLLPLSSIVINTEAHPFPRFNLAPLFSTGWTRTKLNNTNSPLSTQTVISDEQEEHTVGGARNEKGSRRLEILDQERRKKEEIRAEVKTIAKADGLAKEV